MKKRDWAARKVQEATTPPTDEEKERLAIADALIGSFRVTVAGRDVTRWRPVVPPELRKKGK